MIVEYSIKNEEGISREKEISYCWKLKKGKLKTKKLSNIIILDEQEHSAQSADRTDLVQV